MKSHEKLDQDQGKLQPRYVIHAPDVNQADLQHRYKSAHHKISHRKLNDLSRQISGLPVDEAIVQMEFSEKRASSWIKSTLCLARDHAMDKGLARSKLVIGRSMNKGAIS